MSRYFNEIVQINKWDEHLKFSFKVQTQTIVKLFVKSKPANVAFFRDSSTYLGRIYNDYIGFDMYIIIINSINDRFFVIVYNLYIFCESTVSKMYIIFINSNFVYIDRARI